MRHTIRSKDAHVVGPRLTAGEPDDRPEEAQKVVDAFLAREGRGSCEVVRNDGDLLGIECMSYQGSTSDAGVFHAWHGASFNFRRGGSDFQPLALGALARPADPGDASKRAAAWNDALRAVAPGLGEKYFLPYADALGFGDAIMTRGNFGDPTLFPAADVRAWLTCDGVLDLSDAAGGRALDTRSPLAFAYDTQSVPSYEFPRFVAFDAWGAAAATALNSAVMSWAQKERARTEGAMFRDCDVTLSDARAVSVLCRAPTDPNGADGDVHLGITYRLGSNPTRIEAADILGPAPDGALAVIARRCLGHLLTADVESPHLRALPKLTPPDIRGFALEETDLRLAFVAVETVGAGAFEVRETVSCNVPYSALGLRLDALLAPRP